jgi:hypothetical protein
MAYIKIELASYLELQVGDIFRVVQSTGNFGKTVEYEVVSKPVAVNYPHPSFPDFILHDVHFKVKDRQTGRGKTCKYREGATSVWRKA